MKNRRLPHRVDSVYTFADGITMTRGAHTFKAGAYLECDLILSVPGWNQTWMGSFSFNRDTNNPLDANGNQIDSTFGQASGSRAARVMQVSLRFRF